MFALSKCHVTAVGLLAYGSIFLIRKSYPLVKEDLALDNEFSQIQLGIIDFAFYLSYSLGQIFLGCFGNQIHINVMLSSVMIIAALPLMIFFPYLNNFLVLILMLPLVGVCHSIIWPFVSTTVGMQYSDYRNTILSFICNAGFFGKIAGYILTVNIQSRYLWKYSFVFPGIINIVVAVVVYLCFNSQPRCTKVRETPAVHGVGKLLSNRKIIMISSALFVVRMVRFMIYKWSPYFLRDEMLFTLMDSGVFAIIIELPGIIGTAIFGFIQDRITIRKGILVIIACNLVCACALLLCTLYSYHIVDATIWLVIIGFFNCTADSMLSGAVAMNLAVEEESPALVMGFINGVGSLATVVDILIFPLIFLLGGWHFAIPWCSVLMAIFSNLPLISYLAVVKRN